MIVQKSFSKRICVLQKRTIAPFYLKNDDDNNNKGTKLNNNRLVDSFELYVAEID